MKAEIISIGDEILIGQVINTNASWIATELNSIGIEVYQITSVSDNSGHITHALTDASKRADIVLITGGLGPTKDDITTQTLCEYFNTKLVFNQRVYKDLEHLFSIRGYKVSKLNRKQAEVPESCTPLRNIHGTAPGMWFEKDAVIYVSMPGVPFEMKYIIKEEVIPRLKRKQKKQSIYHRTILTQGMGESWLSEKIAQWENELPENTKLAYLPQPGIVRLRLSMKGDDLENLKKIAEEQITKLKEIIPDLIFGYDDDTLEKVTGDLLKKNNLSLSTAESCTGGYIAHLITSVPGSSDYYQGSVVSYSNTIKENFLYVKKQILTDYGAVSEPVVIQMAKSVREQFKTEYSVATSGVAGPDGGSEEKPVGTTWIAIAGPRKLIARKFLFGEHRGRNIRKTALQALNMLRNEIIKNAQE